MPLHVGVCCGGLMNFVALFIVVAIRSTDYNDFWHDTWCDIYQAKMPCDGTFVETKGHGAMMVRKHAVNYSFIIP